MAVLFTDPVFPGLRVRTRGKERERKNTERDAEYSSVSVLVTHSGP